MNIESNKTFTDLSRLDENQIEKLEPSPDCQQILLNLELVVSQMISDPNQSKQAAELVEYFYVVRNFIKAVGIIKQQHIPRKYWPRIFELANLHPETPAALFLETQKNNKENITAGEIKILELLKEAMIIYQQLERLYPAVSLPS